MANADDLIAAFQQLPAAEQAKAGVAIQQVQSLPAPPTTIVAVLWVMVVGAFVLLLVGGTIGLFILIDGGKSTEVVYPLVSAALGVLAGLLAPSPIQGGNG